jgi:undecaprenyl-diphosphatase
MNHTLFQLINASTEPPAWALLAARAWADLAIALIPALLIAGWLRGRYTMRLSMLEAGTAGVLALLIAQVLGILWPMPRPFMIGLGHQWLAHTADASFPSDHLTLWWSVAFSLALGRRTRPVGIALAGLGLPVAWARIYLGVHFPLDMAGAALVGCCAALLARRARRLLSQWILPPGQAVYRRLFAPAIAHGWLRR